MPRLHSIHTCVHAHVCVCIVALHMPVSVMWCWDVVVQHMSWQQPAAPPSPHTVHAYVLHIYEGYPVCVCVCVCVCVE